MRAGVNPYESPQTACERPAASGEPAVRGRQLVFASLLLAVFIEVFPTEADLMWSALAGRCVSLAVAAKATCLAIILIPLFLYVWINGWRGVKAAKGRIIAIGVIVALKLGVDVMCLVNYVSRR
jgi:hypothetical protein